MVRVIIKGGVWRNTEDEILKAAVMKYGKNQWSRIASLLHRKSAKQCKARWYEWLDPGIKKTEWSRTEDEKLLHLAKLMPTQWRTIAPIVGRTAAQCLERYEHLLNEAQRKAEQSTETDDITEAKKLKPGEIDPTPETKPARPDPIDMDEDELEMLSEARARLANTQGKKAKRKAREKQLSEARRLASLQKRRELRAAGILTGAHKFHRKNPTHIDYSSEIPFEKPVPVGFYDPAEDKFEKDKSFKKQTRAEIEGNRRDDIENEERKKDREKLKRRRAEGDPESIFERKNEKKRSKLILPQPQITDKEMEEIVKIGRASDTVRDFSDDNPTSMLLHDYQASFRESAATRVIRTPSVHADALQKEAENLIALQNAQTPLKGGINTPLHDLNLQSALPQSRQISTPNIVLSAVMDTPRSSFEGTPTELQASATPFRDQLCINNPMKHYETRSSELKRALSSLPAPRNDYEIMMPEEELELSQEEISDWIEDASDVDALSEMENESRRTQALQRESKVLQRNLPKPTKINEQSFKPIVGKTDYNKADDLIKAEMLNILEHDVNGKTIDDFNLTSLSAAASVIDNEIKAEEKVVLDANLWSVIDQCSSELILTQNKFTRLGVLPKKDQIDALCAKFNLYRDWMNIRAKKTAKMEKRLKIRLAGYQSIAQNLLKKIEEAQSEIEACSREKATFELLEMHENISIHKRLSKLVDEVRSQVQNRSGSCQRSELLRNLEGLKGYGGLSIKGVREKTFGMDKVSKEIRETELQKRYSNLLNEKYNLEQLLIRSDATIMAQPVIYK
ncbi:unnamed protein product [Dracunculus medinensis]|uniref:Cell division cycle 5-like protein n=1 Tax=Dracunculus medinensis TaxID=318479 RepID=A0A0N4UN07_DRAME|nr:unnamed protein product [Dracunculus medinensis]